MNGEYQRAKISQLQVYACLGILMSFFSIPALSQLRDTAQTHTFPRVDSGEIASTSIQAITRARAEAFERTSMKKQIDESLWLMGAASLDLVDPNVGNGENVGGYSYRVGVTWKHLILMYTDHAARGVPDRTQWEEHRYDYALLGGFCYRGDNVLLNIGGGISKVDYLLKGALLSSSTNSSATNWLFQQRIGTAYGPAAMFNVYFTRSIYEGAGVGAGIGLYESFAKGMRYFALELTLVEINIPVPTE